MQTFENIFTNKFLLAHNKMSSNLLKYPISGQSFAKTGPNYYQRCSYALPTSNKKIRKIAFKMFSKNKKYRNVPLCGTYTKKWTSADRLPTLAA